MEKQMASMLLVQQSQLQRQKREKEALIDELLSVSEFAPFLCYRYPVLRFYYQFGTDPFEMNVEQWFGDGVAVGRRVSAESDDINDLALLFGESQDKDIIFRVHNARNYCSIQFIDLETEAKVKMPYGYGFEFLDKFDRMFKSIAHTCDDDKGGETHMSRFVQYAKAELAKVTTK